MFTLGEGEGEDFEVFGDEDDSDVDEDGRSGGGFIYLSGYLIPYHSNKPSICFTKSVQM